LSYLGKLDTYGKIPVAVLEAPRDQLETYTFALVRLVTIGRLGTI